MYLHFRTWAKSSRVRYEIWSFSVCVLHAYREKIVKSHRVHAHSYGTAGVDRERDRAHDLAPGRVCLDDRRSWCISRPSLAQYQSNLSLRFARVTVQALWESCHEIGTGETDRREHTSPIYNARFTIRNASLDTGHQRLSNYYRVTIWNLKSCSKWNQNSQSFNIIQF